MFSQHKWGLHIIRQVVLMLLLISLSLSYHSHSHLGGALFYLAKEFSAAFHLVSEDVIFGFGCFCFLSSCFFIYLAAVYQMFRRYQLVAFSVAVLEMLVFLPAASCISQVSTFTQSSIFSKLILERLFHKD